MISDPSPPPETEQVTCPRCGGRGICWDAKAENYDTCPRCDGEGVVPSEVEG